jgi:hypothetical protein
MHQLPLSSTAADGPVGPQPHDAIRFQVSWDFETDSPHYYLAHWVTDPTTAERLVGGSNRFSWKDADAVGDCGLCVRWLREARSYLASEQIRRSCGR